MFSSGKISLVQYYTMLNFENILLTDTEVRHMPAKSTIMQSLSFVSSIFLTRKQIMAMFNTLYPRGKSLCFTAAVPQSSPWYKLRCGPQTLVWLLVITSDRIEKFCWRGPTEIVECDCKAGQSSRQNKSSITKWGKRSYCCF